LVLAGGSGTRIGAGSNKVYMTVAGRSLLSYALETFERFAPVDRIVLVIRDADRDLAERALEEAGVSKPVEMVPSGESRHASELAGLKVLEQAIVAGSLDLVVIHDGARPFVTVDLLAAVTEAATRSGGAVPALPVEAPLFRRDSAQPLPGDTIRTVQTPQAFRAGPLLEAYRRAAQEGFEGVDTSETVIRFSGLEVELVAGDPRNLKVTYPRDLTVAESYASSWEAGRWRRVLR
jgi:2-C-methyl-D-erythritol 4-phosphate cytidylyltransferase